MNVLHVAQFIYLCSKTNLLWISIIFKRLFERTVSILQVQKIDNGKYALGALHCYLIPLFTDSRWQLAPPARSLHFWQRKGSPHPWRFLTFPEKGPPCLCIFHPLRRCAYGQEKRESDRDLRAQVLRCVCGLFSQNHTDCSLIMKKESYNSVLMSGSWCLTRSVQERYTKQKRSKHSLEYWTVVWLSTIISQK